MRNEVRFRVLLSNLVVMEAIVFSLRELFKTNFAQVFAQQCSFIPRVQIKVAIDRSSPAKGVLIYLSDHFRADKMCN